MTVSSRMCACGKQFFVWERDFNCDWQRTECRACECKRNGHLFTIYDDGKRSCVICQKRFVKLTTVVRLASRLKAENR